MRCGGELFGQCADAPELFDEQGTVPEYQSYLNSTYFDEISYGYTPSMFSYAVRAWYTRTSDVYKRQGYLTLGDFFAVSHAEYKSYNTKSNDKNDC